MNNLQRTQVDQAIMDKVEKYVGETTLAPVPAVSWPSINGAVITLLLKKNIITLDEIANVLQPE